MNLLPTPEASSAQESVISLLTSVASELQGPTSGSGSLQSLMAKVVGVSGDISQPKLGMKEEMYAELLGKVNVVIHGAANVNHVLPYLG